VSDIVFFKKYIILVSMNKPSDLKFGVEIEGYLQNKSGLICKADSVDLAPDYLKSGIEKAFSALTAEVEIRHDEPQTCPQAALVELVNKTIALKSAAAEKNRQVSFDSHLKADTGLNTIGAHIHIDLSLAQQLRQNDPHFLNLVGSEFMRYYFGVLIKRYCYSERIKSRTKRLLKHTDFDYFAFEDDIVEYLILHFDVKADPVKLIKYRPEKGSLEICLPDSFDVTEEPETLLSLISDAQKAVFDCVARYERDEINPMDNQELKDTLESIF